MLRLYLSLSTCITLALSLLSLRLFRCKILSFDTSVQIPHGICTSISYVINYACHSFCLTSFWCFLAVARPQGYSTPKGVFLSCLIATGFFELPGLAGGFLCTKKRRRMPPLRYPDFSLIPRHARMHPLSFEKRLTTRSSVAAQPLPSSS